MPSYAALLNENDRWAVIAYVQALALSQNTPVTDIDPELRRRLERQVTP
jgi:hypothetical protein